MRRRELRGAEKRNKGCGEKKTLYFGATVVYLYLVFLLKVVLNYVVFDKK